MSLCLHISCGFVCALAIPFRVSMLCMFRFEKEKTPAFFVNCGFGNSRLDEAKNRESLDVSTDTIRVNRSPHTNDNAN